LDGVAHYAGTEGAPGANQKSAAITLEAGKRYYIEALVSDGTGGGHVSVAWAGPGIGDVPTPIGSAYVSAFASESPFLARSPNPASGAAVIGVVNTDNEARAREPAAAWNRLLAAAVALL